MDTKKVQERENLRNIINQWNANRVDLFEISEPNHDLEFHGVMRFYFQDAGQKVATKCIRVSNTATTHDVIQILIEKFRPDIRMLSVPEYALYEIHENGEERKLAEDEMPLLVQLNWHRDDREGRFLLRRMDEKTYLPGLDSDVNSFKRKLSKREKKEKKKREKKEKSKGMDANGEKGKNSLAEKLYTELPETSFTRSISNPEAVMRRRRQQKLEKKLQQFSQEGGAEAGGTLRIFGESINKDVPYKTILLSTRDSAAHAVKEILDKYGKDKEDPAMYCLVQLIVPVTNGDINSITDLHNTPGIREYILDDDDCPLAIEKSHNKSRGVLTFHIRRRPADYQPRKRKKKPKQIKGEMDAGYTKYDETLEKLPFLLEANPDGSEITRGMPKKHYLYLNVTEVGSERSSLTNHSQCLQLFGPNVQARHCVIAHTEGIVTVTPSSRDAETYVNGTRIYETTILQHGMIVRFGKLHTFRFIDPLNEMRRRFSPELMRGSLHSSLRKLPDDLRFNSPQSRGSYETTFDADGNIETTSTASRDERMSKRSDETNGSLQRQFSLTGPPVKEDSHSIQPNSIRKGTDNILPAILELWEEGEDALLNMIITGVDPNEVQFKLAVTYAVYMGARYRASTHFKPEITPNERAHRLTAFTNKVSKMIQLVIKDQYRDATCLAFWVANSSELLHFLKQDRHLSAYTYDAQDLLAESVQLAFRHLVMCQQIELQNALPAFLEDIDENMNENVSITTAKLLNVLSSAMTLLRRCRVNAALTIQLFSQLFHFINMWLFNTVVGVSDSTTRYCTRIWGIRLKKRLIQIEIWAEKQGLELAAECHLSRIAQTAHLLESSKSSFEDIKDTCSKCLKLNSLQLRAILERYQPMLGESPILKEFIEGIVRFAENTADTLVQSDGREIKLEEEPDLQLPFLLPEDGYSCDILRGIPAGLQEFIQPLINADLCHLTIQPTSSGIWTIYMNTLSESAKFGAQTPSFMRTQPSLLELLNKTGRGSDDMQSSIEPVSERSTPAPMNSLLITQQQQQHQQQHQQQPPQNHPIPASLPSQLQLQSPQISQSATNLSGRASTAPLNEPEIQLIKLQKSNNGMGLSIVAARGVNQNRLGIYIKSVVKGGAADQDGRLTAGDQLLKVDGHSLIGITQERAAELMTQTGPVVCLEVAKQGAIYHGLAGILAQPSPLIPRGYNNPRRMSERDIPSRISQEQEMQMRAQRNSQSQQPRIQGSKSVPMLNNAETNANSNGAQPAMQPSAAVAVQQQQRRNEPPVYSMSANHPQFNSMSSTLPAIPKSMSELNNMKATDNGSNSLKNYPSQQFNANYAMNNYSPSRPESQMSMQSQQTNRLASQSYPEERHYQNIQLYQIQQNTQTPASKPSPNSLQPYPHQRILHSSHSSLQHPQDGQQINPQQSSRPLSALVLNRDQEQYMNASTTSANSPRTPSSPHLSNMHSASEQYSNQQYSNAQLVYGRQQVMDAHDSQVPLDYPTRNYPPPQPPFIDARQRDQFRQEAKMEEMRDELRRREERVQPSQQFMGASIRGAHPNNANMQWQRSPLNQPLNYAQHMVMNGAQIRMAPPPAPAPKPPRAAAPVPNQSYPQNAPHMRHSYSREQEMLPPPPTVSYRYGPSGYPPTRQPEPMRSPNSNSQRSSFSNSSNNNRLSHDKSQMDSRKIESHTGVVSPSPWEREEKERVRQQRLEDSKRTRDEEIKYLEVLINRSARQEERLRKLILEKEFQRRAEEIGGEEDENDDEEVLDRADHRERMLSMQQEMEKTRQRRIEREQLMRQNSQQLLHQTRPNIEEWAKRSQNNHIPPSQLEEQEERLRQLRLAENLKQQELDILRRQELEVVQKAADSEAKRRQEEEARYRGYPKQQNISNLQKMPSNNQMNDIPPPLPKSPPPLEAPQRLDRLLLTTASSYQPLNDINQMSDKNVSFDVNQTKYLSALRNGDNMNSALPSQSQASAQQQQQQPQHTPKKVSWNDNPTSPLSDCSDNKESDLSNGQNDSFTLQDIDEVLGSTPGNTTWLSSSYVSGNTPGVIGAQEVYNDPRHRIEADKLKSIQSQKPNVVPEKLSFKEKMKMFAMEAGQQESPKDKVKISKAQREIETSSDPTKNVNMTESNLLTSS